MNRIDLMSVVCETERERGAQSPSERKLKVIGGVETSLLKKNVENFCLVADFV